MSEKSEARREYMKKYHVVWYQKNREKVLKRVKEYSLDYNKRPERIAAKKKHQVKWSKNNHAKVKAYSWKWFHSEKYQEWLKSYIKRDYVKIKSNLSRRIRGLLKQNKLYRTLDYIGCNIKFLKEYLKSKFTSGMSWSNYGEWEIDHIKPCILFDLTKIEEQRKCFHYTNLQPLWKTDNRKKKDKF